MSSQPPVGLPIWLLALAPIALAVAVASLALSRWGMSTSPFATIGQMVGGLAAMLAVVLSLVLVPVGIYSLSRNPALRTTPQIGLIVIGALIAALPFLAMFGGGI
jgi:hypothetical protein